MSDLHPPSFGTRPTETVRESGSLHQGDAGEFAGERCGEGRPASPRCPHCHQPLLFLPADGAAVSCAECGGSFRIENAGFGSTLEEIRQFGRFLLLGRVGQGSFGTVWRARDTELGRLVALKIPHASMLASPQFAERCQHEVRAAAQLRHPGIVRLYEVVKVADLPVLVSDFIEGMTLQDLMRTRKLTFKESAALVADVAETLDYAHSLVVIHRDIKPGNIMVEYHRPPGVAPGADHANSVGKPIIVDFGLALREEAEIVITQPGQIIGTPAYMSPEQASGSGHRADRRSDIYSLGVVLYELLTGELPFRGTKLALLHQVLHEEPRPPRRVNDKIPLDLETICLAAMAKEHGKRYPTAGEFAADLRRYLRNEPISRRPVGRFARFWRWCRRYPAVAIPTAAAFFILIAGTIISSYFAFVSFESSERAREKAELLGLEKNLSDRRFFGSEMTLAQQELRKDHPGSTLARLLSPDLPGEASVPRTFDWYYLYGQCKLDLASFAGHSATVNGLAISADGCLLASAGDDHKVVVRDIAEGEIIFAPLSAHTGSVTAVAFSPDKRLLASGGEAAAGGNGPPQGEVKIWDLSDQLEVFSIPPQPGPVRCVTFSPDGKYLAFGGGMKRNSSRSRPGFLKVWNVKERRLAFELLEGHTEAVTAVSFRGDSLRLASASMDATALIWDVTAPRSPPLRISPPHMQPLLCVAFSPDGRQVACAGFDPAVLVWDVAGREPRLEATFEGHSEQVRGVAFGPCGRHLASAGADKTVRIWDLTTGRSHRLLGHSGGIFGLAFSPDGWRLASAGEGAEIKLWDVAGTRESLTLAGHGYIDPKAPNFHSGRITAVTFSPDGKTVATASMDRTVKIWRPDLGVISQTWRGHSGPVRALAFSPDGSLVASGSEDKTIIIWSFPGGKKLRTLVGHTNKVVGLAFSPDGASLASASTDQTLRIWDVSSGSISKTISGQFGNLSCFNYCPVGPSLPRVEGDGPSIVTQDFVTGEVRSRVPRHRVSTMACRFSPNGLQLATAGKDNLLKLWDLSSGKGHVLNGHAGLIYWLSFSPDGNRLASAGDDKTVRVWDTVTRQQLLCLEGHDASVISVAFDCNGRLIASADDDGKVKIWDGRPWSPDIAAQRQAISLVEHLFRELGPEGDVATHIRRTPGISEVVRQKALAVEDPYRRSIVHRDADAFIQKADREDLLMPDLLERIKHDSALSESVRREALSLARHFVENAIAQHNRARDTVRQSGRDKPALVLAAARAETAVRLDPNSFDFQVTLGMAYYRLERYREAVAILERVAAEPGEAGSPAEPLRLAFLAMAEYRLRREPEAKTALDSLGGLMKQPQFSRHEDAKAALREAEALISNPHPSEAK